MSGDPADPSLGEAIRQLRASRNETQEDVAYHAGISVGNLGSIEAGRANPSWTTVGRIAQALGVDLHELVDAIEESRAG